MDKLQTFNKKQIKNPKLTKMDLRPGDTVRIHQRIKEEKKERIQVFEGVVIDRKHGKGINATFTVRKISSGVGVEKTFPLHAPFIEKIEIVKRAKVRQGKLYYLRKLRGKKAKLKQKQFESVIIEEEKPVVVEEDQPETEKEEKKEDESKEEVKTEAKAEVPKEEVKDKPEEKVEKVEKEKAKEAKEKTENKS